MAEQGKVSEHVALIFKAFHSDDGIAYQELDSMENNDLYSELSQFAENLVVAPGVFKG